MAESGTPEALLEDAIQAEKFAEALATGLGQAGASPDTIKTVGQCAEVFRQVAAALGKGHQSAPDEAEPAPQHDPYGHAAAETQAAMQASAAKQQGAQK